MLTASSAAAADAYGRPFAIAAANRREAQQSSMAATACSAGAELNAARVNGNLPALA